MTSPRILHYVTSTHWDREWYDTFQGFRLRLVKMLDEVLDACAADPAFRFDMDGQAIPLADYAEVRRARWPEMLKRISEGRVRVGPFYVLPDEFLISGESLVRNLELGHELAREWGGVPSGAGFLCDMFGHISQMPQVLRQFAIHSAYIWRGTSEREHGGNSRWLAPDGTGVATHRFGWNGYCSLWFDVRENAKDAAELTTRLVATARAEADRTPTGPVLLFDGADHMEIEPRMPAVIAAANLELAADGLHIRFGDLDLFGRELQAFAAAGGVPRELHGELREFAHWRASEPPRGKPDNQWVIPGVASSRIVLKQRNAACEDLLTLWAEPFAASAAPLLGDDQAEWLRVAWKHLLDNHPHDSLCGCSIDQVHQDMIFRFDQAEDLANRIAERALRALAVAAAPRGLPEKSFVVAVANATAAPLDEVIELEIPLPDDWPTQYQEYFGYERKFGFTLRTADGRDIPWQYVSGHRAMQRPPHRPRIMGQGTFIANVIRIAARVQVPAQGLTTLSVEPSRPFDRHLGSLVTAHQTVTNDHVIVAVNPNGSLRITHRATGKVYDQALTFEDRADIGDGWFHGVAVNDRCATSAASAADVQVIADGPELATLRIALALNLPAEFDFTTMRPVTRTEALKIVVEVTVRRDSPRIECAIQVDNTVKDHRLRVLMPTGISAPTFLTDAAFDIVERPVALPADYAKRRELPVETQPQQSWAAYGDALGGLAVVSRGQPEVAVIDRADRPLALTLFRAFRRAVMSDLDANPGGQMQGPQRFSCWLVPFAGAPDREALSHLGQRVLSPVRTIVVRTDELSEPTSAAREYAGVAVTGAVVTARRLHAGKQMVRLFNPHAHDSTVTITGIPSSAVASDLNGAAQTLVTMVIPLGMRFTLPPKRITTLRW